jgi:hypothetical protein
MIDRMLDRCKRICGDINTEGCFVNDKNQLSCISDMAVNKATSIAMMLEFALMDDDPEFLKENIREALTQNNELLNWIKYLRLVGDLQKLGSLVLDSDENEKRKEIRYPIVQDGVVSYTLSINDKNIPIEMINFSQSGVRFTSVEELKSTELVQCKLVCHKPEGSKDISLRVKYCAPEGDGYIIGARIESMGGQSTFNFFAYILQLHIDISALLK